MRNVIILSVLVFSTAIVTQTHAQSGSRGGGGSYSGGGSGFGGLRRLSRLERQQRAQQQALVGQQLAQQTARLQAEQAKQQFKRTLSQLTSSDNRSANSRQNRVALEQAKRDYKSLRKQQVAPNQLGPLQQPFRLTRKDIDRQNHTANWPEALRDKQFDSLVRKIDRAIMNQAIDNSETAAQFLNDLARLNTSLNTTAANGQVNISNYARARRFITGLANEIRATEFVM